MRFIDWFAGIGGFRRGLELAGHECVGFCEYDDFAVASYTAMHLITKEQARYLKSLTLKQRQKEILKPEYRNGEWYAKDIRKVKGGDIPRADAWCGGFPCTDLSVAGRQSGLKGEHSGLFYEIIRLLKEQEEENKPEWIILENVKNLLSINKGWDFARVLFALGKAGYNCSWQVFNSKDHGVPQNRERVYIVGHLGGKRGRKVFPFKGTGGEDSVQGIEQIGSNGTAKRHNPQTYRVYDPDKLAPCLQTMEGGGREPHIPVTCFDPSMRGLDGHYREYEEKSPPLTSRIYKEPLCVSEPVGIKVLGTTHPNRHSTGDIHSSDGIMSTCTSRDYKQPKLVSVTLAALDRHGAAAGMEAPRQGDGIFVETEQGFTVYAVWYEKYKCYIAIRKLTPKECFRLQGWEDKYFNRAAWFNSDSQLYKQAGNGVSVPVVEIIGNLIK